MPDRSSVTLAATAAAAAAAAAAVTVWLRRRRSSARHWVLVACAVREEARFVEEALEELCEVPLIPAARRRVRGCIGGLQVDVVTVGIGEVDASIACTAACLESGRPPLAVLSVGCSGAHRADLLPGDVVLGSAVVPLACRMVRASGESEHVGHRPGVAEPPLPELPASPLLLRTARAAAAEVAPSLPAWPDGGGREPRPVAVHVGRVGSTDTWTQHVPEIERLHATLGTVCEEMEAYAVARVGQTFGAPVLFIKDISNSELHISPYLPISPHISNSELLPAPEPQHAETGAGESILLEEMGRRAAAVAAATIRRLARGVAPEAAPREEPAAPPFLGRSRQPSSVEEMAELLGEEMRAGRPPPTSVTILFGRPGAGKSTVADAVLAAAIGGDVFGEDLDVCVPLWMRDNFARGVYPTLPQRRAFAQAACDHLEARLRECAAERRAAGRQAAAHCLVSFSFVNADLRDAFRARFPAARWVLMGTSDALAAERVAQREGHFYKAPAAAASGSEWAFAPVDFEHTLLDGSRPVDENAVRVLKELSLAKHSWM